jgi:hypothetical protein
MFRRKSATSLLIAADKLVEENLPFGSNSGNGLGNDVIPERGDKGRKGQNSPGIGESVLLA